MGRENGLTDWEVLAQTTDFVAQYFDNPKFDSSHDIHHVLRVRDTALQILEKEKTLGSAGELPALNPLVVELAALLHDVDDKKYRIPNLTVDTTPDRCPEVMEHMNKVAPELALQIYEIVEGVSYSSEIRDPAKVCCLIEKYPELAIVQDADRLDALGAIGIGRCFTFGGARGTSSMGDAIEHFEAKLLKLEGMMKTKTGKCMAAERSRRIREFMSWWKAEGGPVGGRK